MSPTSRPSGTFGGEWFIFYSLFHRHLFSTPYLVILRNRGQELRFYKGQNLRLKEDELRKFLKAEDWKYTPVWSSSFAPGGDK